MKYVGMPLGMWLLFVNSFRRELTDTLNLDKTQAKALTASAKHHYQVIIRDLPDFKRMTSFR